jgi:hypothetical protein
MKLKIYWGSTELNNVHKGIWKKIIDQDRITLKVRMIAIKIKKAEKDETEVKKHWRVEVKDHREKGDQDLNQIKHHHLEEIQIKKIKKIIIDNQRETIKTDLF